MDKNQMQIAELFNRFESSIFKLIFMEAALRGMIQTGIIEEPKVSEGISGVFSSITQEFELIKDQFQNSKPVH
ncbi:MAG: hypothetical protein MI862_11155 [Desulfobacterales bacterium]|nr:hypothetical protein [Desulfobacterales bacterium]